MIHSELEYTGGATYREFHRESVMTLDRNVRRIIEFAAATAVPEADYLSRGKLLWSSGSAIESRWLSRLADLSRVSSLGDDAYQSMQAIVSAVLSNGLPIDRLYLPSGDEFAIVLGSEGSDRFATISVYADDDDEVVRDVYLCSPGDYRAECDGMSLQDVIGAVRGHLAR